MALGTWGAKLPAASAAVALAESFGMGAGIQTEEGTDSWESFVALREVQILNLLVSPKAQRGQPFTDEEYLHRTGIWSCPQIALRCRELLTVKQLGDCG